MEALQSWTAMLCAVSVVCAALRMLTPQKGVGKMMQTVLAGMFLCAVLLPIKEGISLPTFTPFAEEDGEEDTFTMQVLNDTVLRVCNEALASYGYTAEKVAVEADISEESSISIVRVWVYVDAENYRQWAAIRQITAARLECETVVRPYEG